MIRKALIVLGLMLTAGMLTMGCAKTPIVLKVGDKIPPFERFSIGIPIEYTGGTYTKKSGEIYHGPLIEIPKNTIFTHPKNKKRYICTTDGGCIIHMEKFVILRGETNVPQKR